MCKFTDLSLFQLSLMLIGAFGLSVVAVLFAAGFVQLCANGYLTIKRLVRSTGTV